MMWRKMLFLAVLILTFATGVLGATPYVVVDEPDLQGTVIYIGDLYSRNEQSCLIARGSSVYLQDSTSTKELITDIPGQISALALGDLSGDFRNNLIIGTTSVGAIYIYGEQNGGWFRQSDPHYLWETIIRMEVSDFNDDGWGDLVLLTEGGQARILLSHEGRLQQVWESPSDQVVTDWHVVDVDGSGVKNFVYTLESGYIGVLRWEDENFTTLWENYPWGQIRSLAVAGTSDNPELIVVTSQKMLYGWRWRSSEMVVSRHFYGADLGEIVRYVPGQGLLSLSKKTGISLFQLKTNSVEELWRIPGVVASQVFVLDNSYLLRDPSNIYYRLIPSGGQWRIFVEAFEITDLVHTFEEDGQLYFDLAALGKYFDYKVFYLDGWLFFQDELKFKLHPDKNFAEHGNLQIPLGGSIVEREGSLYGTPGVFSLFGWSLDLDLARRQVILQKSWGWWL